MRLDYAMRALALLSTIVLSPVRIDSRLTGEPRVDRIEPAAAKPGAAVTGFGVNLNRSHVEDLILIRGDMFILTRIIEQQDNLIRFRIPRALAAGQYRLVL